MVCWMQQSKLGCEPQLIGLLANNLNNHKRSYCLIVKLLAGSADIKVLGIEIDLISCFEYLLNISFVILGLYGFFCLLQLPN